MAYDLDQFISDCRSTLSRDPGPAGREQVRQNLERLLANKDFIEEYCGVAPDRLVGVAVMPDIGVDEDIVEMKRCKEKGFKAVRLHTFPSGKSYPTPEDDKFWAASLDLDMPLTKARILVRDLDVRPADAEGDAAFLARLGLFAARRWTPRAAVSGPDGLWLDLTGVAHLLGGEQAMRERILAFCRRLGLVARIAVAGTTGAAHALARFGGRNPNLCPTRGEASGTP